MSSHVSFAKYSVHCFRHRGFFRIVLSLSCHCKFLDVNIYCFIYLLIYASFPSFYSLFCWKFEIYRVDSKDCSRLSVSVSLVHFGWVRVVIVPFKKSNKRTFSPLFSHFVFSLSRSLSLASILPCRGEDFRPVVESDLWSSTLICHSIVCYFVQ